MGLGKGCACHDVINFCARPGCRQGEKGITGELKLSRGRQWGPNMATKGRTRVTSGVGHSTWLADRELLLLLVELLQQLRMLRNWPGHE